MHLIRVGRFDLYPTERRLCAAGKPLELGARAFDMLLVLVETPGRLVTKSTLLERVWPRVIVDENNLAAQIASLRRILGSQAIRTVPGFGYRLELEVSHLQTDSELHGVDATPTAQQSLAPRLRIPRHTWPYRLGPLIGREKELRDISHALSRSNLVTLVGAAGVGKTRLAQEILSREAEVSDASVAWCSLAPLKVLQHVPSALALALGLPLPDGVDGFAALAQGLRSVPLLLILDCADRLAAALAAPLAGLLSQCPEMRALVTSQAPLGIAGETVYRLAALPVPDVQAPCEEAEHYGAVALFIARAAAADRMFALSLGNVPAVTEICRKLDGNPLALELAAARVPALGIGGLLERLDDRFRLLKVAGHSPDPRHGALLTALDWSHGLLTPVEQQVFRRLAAFPASFSLDIAARCVADETLDALEAIDVIGRLVDRSLVTVLAVDPPRYSLLETTRHYALERLIAAGELESTRERMAGVISALLDMAYDEYWSLDETLWLRRYEPELPSVRAVMDWATDDHSEAAVAIFGSAWPLFVETDLHAEGRARYEKTLALLRDSLPRTRLGRFWEAIATYDSTHQCDRARYAAELAASMYSGKEDTRFRYYALLQLASNWRVDTAAARVAFATARELEDLHWPARLLTFGALTEGALCTSAGQFEAARAAYQRAMRLALVTSERQALAATVSIVELDIACGDTASALQLARPLVLSLRHLGRGDTRFELLALTFSALLMAGELGEARTTGAELYEVANRLDPGKLYSALDSMAFLACVETRYEEAARIAAYADTAHESHGQVRRRPAQERIRSSVLTTLQEKLGPDWRSARCAARDALDETSACGLALGRYVG
jgi:predicted ATPase/DNA-binding winged helix-turn-helix (wHTH) protein